MGSVPPIGPMRDGVLPMPQEGHGIVGVLEFDKAHDMPYPHNPKMTEIYVLVNVEEQGKKKEIKRVGPFAAVPQSKEKNLAMADCAGSRSIVHAPMHFGGEAKEGAMYCTMSVAYVMEGNQSHFDVVGETGPVMVTFHPQRRRYYELRQPGNNVVLGGLSMSHRLMTEQEANAQQGPTDDVVKPVQPKIGPVEVFSVARGRTGNFPPGSPEEALEQAAINEEAQNRALLQRCKNADPNFQEFDLHTREVNGYREWDGLDSLFGSMGPNPMVFSEEVGPVVTRGYQDNTSVIKEVGPKLGVVACPADEELNLQLLNGFYKGDPFQPDSKMRPVVCKDPKEIGGPRDMTWCPDPAIYVPTRNLNEEDKETVRLACYAPSQTAKLRFADVNPAYVMNEDIWGVLRGYRGPKSVYMPKPPGHRKRRVKDDCIMA